MNFLDFDSFKSVIRYKSNDINMIDKNQNIVKIDRLLLASFSKVIREIISRIVEDDVLVIFFSETHHRTLELLSLLLYEGQIVAQKNEIEALKVLMNTLDCDKFNIEDFQANFQPNVDLCKMLSMDNSEAGNDSLGNPDIEDVIVKVEKDIEQSKLNELKKEKVMPPQEQEREDQDFKIKVEEMKDEKNKSNQCPFCDYKTAWNSNVLNHIQYKHKGIRFKCDKCDFGATTRSALKRHNQLRHEGVMYPCTFCQYTAGRQDCLQRHIQSVHEGVKYACKQCNYQATDKGNLKKHQEYKHEKETSYNCENCSYATSYKRYLRIHIERKHTVTENMLKA